MIRLVPPPSPRLLAGLRLSLLAGLVAAPLSAGEIVTDRDAHVFGGARPIHDKAALPAQESNFGASRHLELKTTPGKGDGFTRKAYLSFDLSGLPRLPAEDGALSLRLVVRQLSVGAGGDTVLTEQPLVLYLLKESAEGEDWVEGSGRPDRIEHGLATGSIHWLNAPANAPMLGNRVSSRDAIEAGRIVVPNDARDGTTILIPIHSAALADLNSRRRPARATFILAIADGTDDLLRIHSRESTLSARRPALVW
jgi:hypothetical protein